MEISRVCHHNNHLLSSEFSHRWLFGFISAALVKTFIFTWILWFNFLPVWDPEPSLTLFSPVQYKTSKEGSVMGVTVSRVAMLAHCQALSQACNYSEGG